MSKKVFITGGTGFIGQALIKQLIAKDYHVTALARTHHGAQKLKQLGATPIIGDIIDAHSMRPGMEGADILFHVAAWYKLGSPDWMQAETINVGGTRKVMRLALELNIPKIVYTSTIAVFGNTDGELVDENYYAAGPFLTEYDRTKWLAHYKVVLPLIQKGAPITIVMPGVVYGPGDTSFLHTLMSTFYRGEMPIVFGPETTLTFAHVEDVATGHILAAEKGTIGESYILAGPAIPLGEMFDFWAHLDNRATPLVRIPAFLLHPFIPLIKLFNRFYPLPPMYSAEAIRSLGAQYTARADKARAQLGWQTRSLHDGMREMMDYVATTSSPPAPKGERRVAKLILLAALILYLYWRWRQRRQKA
ncbi:MAG TPA: NAD-dependent epimerase/dehydratase family protein [Anaerolineae bacterium]|nr:NAD-dependent epimerase/dehydratase family protein [Anaerolineae bacterium]